MICDLYAVIDRHLGPEAHCHHDRFRVANAVADMMAILPPRAHTFHQLSAWQRTYRSPSWI